MRIFDYKKNTNSDWEQIGQTNPYWGVLTDEKFLNKNLNQDALDDFFKSGRERIAGLASEWNNFNNRKLKAVLDFGSGVGRLAIPMSAYAEQAVGIEISDSMIAEFNKNVKLYKIDNLKVYKTVEDMLSSGTIKFFDWINSYIVFQHIPPETGYRILEQLLSILKAGGYFSLHFTIFKSAPPSAPSSKEEFFQQIDSSVVKILSENRRDAPGEIQMYDYDINKIYYLFLKHGIDKFSCFSENHESDYSLYFTGRKRKYTFFTEDYITSLLYGAENWSQAITELKGFSAESWGAWTIGGEALISVCLRDELCGKKLEIYLEFRMFLNKEGWQSFKLYANDALVAEYKETENKLAGYNANIPFTVTARNQDLTIRFEIASPTSPSDLGLSDDARKLGLGISKFAIKPVVENQGTEPSAASARRRRK